MFLMSVTNNGYKDRTSWSIAAIEALFHDESWTEGPNDEFENARDVANIIRRVVRNK